MAIFFSGDEIIKMAVKTEETGYEFYRAAQKNTQSEKLKDLFDYLAKEELKHKTIYLGLEGSIEEHPQGVPVDWDELGHYIKAMTDSSLFLGEDSNINVASRASSDIEAIDFAIGFEKDTLLFFYQVNEIVKAADKHIVEKIIQEEKQHIKKLMEMKKTI
ncbi:ferritin family protein [bacterium]|nr:ferritin family protein [bacterium]